MKNLSVMSENLLELVKKGESEEIELKKSTAQLDRALKSISQKIRQRIKHETSPGIKVLEIEEKSIIEVTISEGRNKPYSLDGICYKRVGTENIIISPEKL